MGWLSSGRRAAGPKREEKLITAEQPERESYRAIVLSQDGKELLLLPAGTRLLLPAIEVPRWQRVAEKLTSAVHTRWGHEVICLFSHKVSSPPGVARGVHYQVMECCHRSQTRDANWVEVSALSQDSFADAADYIALRTCLGQREACSTGSARGPFVAPGWFEELLKWAEETIHPFKLHLTGSFRQFNASPSFSLIRFETSGPAIWFKAVGEPNLREFPVTLTLAQLFPEYLPQVLAARPAWNGWIASEAEGTMLADTREIAAWTAAARALAELQIESIGQVVRILNSGGRDMRVSKLSSLLSPFLDSMGRIMKEQTAMPPAALTREELVQLGKQLECGLAGLDELDVPDTLGHLDLNPGNIVVFAKKCTFLDWAEAYVGHPFFSFQYLLEYFCRAMGPDSGLEAELTVSYAEVWQAMAPAETITEALALSPMLAVFAYAVGSDSWDGREDIRPGSARHLRSLTRRMNREALRWTNRGSRCLC